MMMGPVQQASFTDVIVRTILKNLLFRIVHEVLVRIMHKLLVRIFHKTAGQDHSQKCWSVTFMQLLDRFRL